MNENNFNTESDKFIENYKLQNKFTNLKNSSFDIN